MPNSTRSLTITDSGSRKVVISGDFDYTQPLNITSKGIRTTNVRIRRTEGQSTRQVHVEAEVSSFSTTLRNRIHTTSNTETTFGIEVDWSIWDLGMATAEIIISMPVLDQTIVHPGLRIDVPTGSIGATLLGNTMFRYLDLTTGHGPAHLSDVAVTDSLKLTAHQGNITVHDVTARDGQGKIEVVGQGAWMDIDDVHAVSLTASSTDALISLKDIEATHTIEAKTTNARIGLGNVKANTLIIDTCQGGEIVAQNVSAAVCEAKTTRGNIEGDWHPTKKLYLSTTEASISARVSLVQGSAKPDTAVETVLNSKNGPIDVQMPASYEGTFSLKTTGFYKAFIHTSQHQQQPILHVSQPDKKAGTVGQNFKGSHSIQAITEEAPIALKFDGF